MIGRQTLVREADDWHPNQPYAEQEAQVEAKGLYTEPTHHFMIFDEDEDDPEVEPVARNFDL